MCHLHPDDGRAKARFYLYLSPYLLAVPEQVYGLLLIIPALAEFADKILIALLNLDGRESHIISGGVRYNLICTG